MMNEEMSPREFDDYVGLLSRLLKLRASQREAIAEELRLHLEERFAGLTEQGVRPQQAISMALAEFGDAAALAAQFSSVAKLQKRRWMMRVGVTSVVTVLLAVAVAVSMWPDPDTQWAGATARAEQTGEDQNTKEQSASPSDPFTDSSSSAFSEAKANEATMAKLQAIGAFPFQDETELGVVLDFLSRKLDVQFLIDSRAVEEQDIASDTLIRLHLEKVPLEMCLRMMLKQLDLTYMLDNGVVIITTPDEAQANLKIAVYRVDGLVRPEDETRRLAKEAVEAARAIPKAYPQSPIGSQQPAQEASPQPKGETGKETGGMMGGWGGGMGMGGMPGGMFSVQDLEANDTGGDTFCAQGLVGGDMGKRMGGALRKDHRDITALIELITSVVEPESWQEVGGYGMITEYRGVLVVSQTTRIQMKVDKLLRQLRETIEAQQKP